eukprot:5317161-Amphidinium_carterae.1
MMQSLGSKHMQSHSCTPYMHGLHLFSMNWCSKQDFPEPLAGNVTCDQHIKQVVRHLRSLGLSIFRRPLLIEFYNVR